MSRFCRVESLPPMKHWQRNTLTPTMEYFRIEHDRKPPRGRARRPLSGVLARHRAASIPLGGLLALTLACSNEAPGSRGATGGRTVGGAPSGGNQVAGDGGTTAGSSTLGGAGAGGAPVAGSAPGGSSAAGDATGGGGTAGSVAGGAGSGGQTGTGGASAGAGGSAGASVRHAELDLLGVDPHRRRRHSE